MVVQNHATREELYELLQGTTETARVKLIGDHVHQCLECRQALDAMAAQSAIWRKMPILLKEIRTQEASPPKEAWVREDDSISLEWDEENALDQMLEAPRHPEMLGRIGKYEVEREVGRGGMGVVLKAFDAELNRPVAIKILSPHLASHGTARRRFAQEAIAAAGVLHPNVIAVYGVNNEGKTPFIVMPFIDGPSLQKMVEQSGPLSEIEVVRVAMQIASGLAAAHAQGLVHRDIKPANILTEGGVHRVLITDFGLARAEADASLTRTGWLMGTPNYMSPEQSKGQRADSRSDLFSLGSLLYFISTGRLPFRAETPLGVLHRIQNDQPTPVRQLNHQISQTLSDIIEMLLQKAPSERFQTAAELHDLLQHHLAYLHQPDASKPPSIRRVKKFRFHARRLPTTAVFACLFLCCMALGFSGWGPSWEPPAVPNFLSGSFASLLSLQKNDDETDRQQGIQAFNGRSLYQEGMRLYEKKRYTEAMEKFQQATRDPRYRAKSHYNIACILARNEKNSEAIEALNKAVEFGYVDARHYRTDGDLQSLREEAGFKNLMERLAQLDKAEEVVEKGRRESEEGRYLEAEKYYRAALEIHRIMSLQSPILATSFMYKAESTKLCHGTNEPRSRQVFTCWVRTTWLATMR